MPRVQRRRNSTDCVGGPPLPTTLTALPGCNPPNASGPGGLQNLVTVVKPAGCGELVVKAEGRGDILKENPFTSDFWSGALPFWATTRSHVL